MFNRPKGKVQPPVTTQEAMENFAESMSQAAASVADNLSDFADRMTELGEYAYFMLLTSNDYDNKDEEVPEAMDSTMSDWEYYWYIVKKYSVKGSV